MNRKKKILVFTSILTVLAVFGTIGGIALADDDVANPVSKFTAKVASILGIEETALQGAFEQARTELAAEAQDAWLDKIVADGKATQEEADAYKAWLDAKPEGFPRVGWGANKMFRMRGYTGWFKQGPPPAAAE